MKRAVVLISLLIFAKTLFGQAYIITYIKGTVYHENKPLKLHDKLDGVTQITSNDKTAELALFSAQKGKFRLSFANSKPVAATQAAKNSELYQLVVGNYLLAYTTEKMLTTRGDFDIKAFFNSADNNGNVNRVFLPVGELLPLKSQSVAFGPNDKFYLCSFNGRDSVCNLIRRNKGFLIFDEQAIKGIATANSESPEPVICYIKRVYSFNDKDVEEHLSSPVSISFLSKEYLQSVASSFEEGAASYYQDDKSKLIADIEEQLTYYYGKCFEPAVHQVLRNDLTHNINSKL